MPVVLGIIGMLVSGFLFIALLIFVTGGGLDKIWDWKSGGWRI